MWNFALIVKKFPSLEIFYTTAGSGGSDFYQVWLSTDGSYQLTEVINWRKLSTDQSYLLIKVREVGLAIEVMTGDVSPVAMFLSDPGRSDPIYVSGPLSLSKLRLWNFTDVTLADEDTNWITNWYDKTLPEAQRTQGIESITWITFLTEISLK